MTSWILRSWPAEHYDLWIHRVHSQLIKNIDVVILFSYLALLFPGNHLCFVITLLHQFKSQLLVHLRQFLFQREQIVHTSHENGEKMIQSVWRVNHTFLRLTYRYHLLAFPFLKSVWQDVSSFELQSSTIQFNGYFNSVEFCLCSWCNRLSGFLALNLIYSGHIFKSRLIIINITQKSVGWGHGGKR